MTMHTEFMRKHGFPSGEASRLHQYHQYLQQRFEQLRILKYYRTPQAARSFGRAYLIILPWIVGPYFAWVFESTNADYPYTLVLAAFTFLILIGEFSMKFWPTHATLFTSARTYCTSHVLTFSHRVYYYTVGLLNTIRGLEDPFVADMRGWAPGIDNVKLEFECAVILQGIEQFYANAKMHQVSEVKNDWEVQQSSVLRQLSNGDFEV